MAEINTDAPARGAFVAPARFAAGVVYGALLYVVFELSGRTPLFGVSEADWPRVLAGLRTAAVFAPLPLIFGLGSLPIARLAAWVAIAAGGLFYVGQYAPTPVWGGVSPLVSVWLFSLIVIYVVHEFLQAAHDDRRAIARYPTYFDVAWRHAFQAVLALLFVGAFWIVLWLGAAMFGLIGLQFFRDLIRTEEFAWIASASVFALGVHWTDAGSGLTRGAREIGLFLKSWLCVLLTLILTAFLGALPFTGLEPLWDTKRATVLLLNAAATMILLVNAAYQAGDPPTAGFVRRVVRFSAAPLLGVVALAFLGLWLRIDQYGFTPARVLASAELAIVAFYAVGYVVAAVRPFAIDEPWMAFVRPVNIAGAALVAVVLVALMTPVLDPARVSVANQVARLDAGVVEPDDFDFGFLADERAGRHGARALERLAARSGSDRDERIALLAQNPGGGPRYGARTEQTFNDRRAALRFVDGSAPPDAAFLPPARGADPVGACVTRVKRVAENAALEAEENRRNGRLGRDAPQRTMWADQDPICPARFVDLNADGAKDLLILLSDGDGKAIDELSIAGVLLDETGVRQRLVGLNLRRYVEPGARGDWSGGIALDPLAKKERFDEDAYEKAFAEAQTVPARFNNLLIDGTPTPILPVRARIDADVLAARIEALDGREAPDGVLVDTRVRSVAETCLPLSRPTSDRFCFRSFVDAFADPSAGEAYAVIDMDAGGDWASITVYAGDGAGDGLSEPVGQASFRRATPRRFAKERGGDAFPDTRAGRLAFEADGRARAVEGFAAVPPLVGDLMIGGARATFSFVDETAEDEGER